MTNGTQHDMIDDMKAFNWNYAKNQKLIAERGVSFEDVLYLLQNELLLDDIEHPNKIKYAHQRIFIVEIDHTVYLVPYVENEDEIFLKTIIPSRKATRQYLGGDG